MEPISELRSRILPVLRSWADGLKADYRDVTSQVFDCSVGKLTEYQGHVVGIDCILNRAGPDEVDHVGLVVSIKHLNRTPMIDSAEVVWGNGRVELGMLADSVEFSEANLDKLVEQLPQLHAALVRALRRGLPASG